MRAPVNVALTADFALHLFGTTGCLKSSLAALFASFFGEFEHSKLPASFADTAASLEFKANVVHDAVIVVDELVVKTNSAYDDAVAKAVQLFRSVGNGSARGRMRRDLTVRAARPPNALIVATGEQLPLGESVRARTLSIQLRPGDVDLQLLSRSQAQIHLLGEFMRTFVEWLRRRLGLIETWAKPRQRELRSVLVGAGRHRRAPATVAHLMIGAELFVDFCEYEGLFTDQERAAFLERSQVALLEAAAQQEEVVAEANPASLFLAILGELLQTGAVELGGERSQATAPSGRPRVGWRKNGEIVLLPETAYGAVAKALRDRGEAMPVPRETLWRRLRDDGLLITDADGKDPKRVFEGARRRVKVLRGDALNDVYEQIATAVRPPLSPGLCPPTKGAVR
jgi:hypothetical protein